MAEHRKTSYLHTSIVLALAFAILIPSLFGFAVKFLEFIAVYRESPDGAFAIAPMVNYFLATSGFFLLLLWAIYNGMFSDVERPKYWMLENEQSLDQRLSVIPAAQAQTAAERQPLTDETPQFISRN